MLQVWKETVKCDIVMQESERANEIESIIGLPDSVKPPLETYGYEFKVGLVSTKVYLLPISFNCIGG